MATKILICGHNLYGYLDAMARGFIEAGADVAVYEHENTNVLKLHYRNWFKRKRAEFKINRINRCLRETVATFRPDILLGINGEVLLERTVAELSCSLHTVLWIVDAVANIKLPMSTIARFGKVYVFEPADLTVVPGASYLAYGVDESCYQSLADSEGPKEYDLSFVGSAHDNRLPILEEVARFCAGAGFRFGVFGPFKPFAGFIRGRACRHRFPHLARALVRNRKLTPAEVNEVYNISTINLNIHHEQSVEGLNPRTFEIPAAGGFELVDFKPRLADYFRDGEDLVSYRDLTDLTEKIRYYLSNDRERSAIAAHGCRTARTQHTFTSRCRRILEENTRQPRLPGA